MIINFTGDISGLEFGIKELAANLNVTLGNNGYCFELIKKDSSDIIISFENKNGSIVYSKKCHFFRAFGLAVEQLQKGNGKFTVIEHPQFDSNGPMFDLSQGNAAFNVKTFKSILRLLALMGLDTVMMYCEDGFEVKTQPYLGYMRARYTPEEIKELDDYAFGLGIELIPHIQALAHMQEALHWKHYAPIMDYDACLLVGEEKTYEFIKDVMSNVSSCFRTKKMHLGMDEAFHLGRGEYLTRNGYKDITEIMKEHLEKVSAIADELGITPMMWDHMYFRTFGTRKDYQPGATISEETKRLVPKNMINVYGDYYKMSEEWYYQVIKQHKELCDKVVFAGGIWSWLGYGFAWTKQKYLPNALLTPANAWESETFLQPPGATTVRRRLSPSLCWAVSFTPSTVMQKKSTMISLSPVLNSVPAETSAILKPLNALTKTLKTSTLMTPANTTRQRHLCGRIFSRDFSITISEALN